MWRRCFAILSSRTLRNYSTQTLTNLRRISKSQREILERCSATQASVITISEQPQTLRLWSDSGGDDAASSPFDDLGAWHQAEAPSFLHNVSVDSVGASTNTGKRDYNEDRFQILELDPDFYYFAVFDGHGGSAPVDFVQSQLHHIIQRLHRKNSDLEKLLVEAFEECDYELQKHMKWLIDEQGCDSWIERGGTTATVTLLKDGSELAVGSVGDSRALLCHNGETICLTNDHHPSRNDERERIEKNNGWIDQNSQRVNGRLAMTRSLGDFDVKPYGVIATPETTSLKIDHRLDAFLELHTDGVSHVMSGNELGFIVRMCSNPEEAANALTSCALQYGAEDNVTSLVVPLRAWSKFCSRNVTKNNIMRVNCI